MFFFLDLDSRHARLGFIIFMVLLCVCILFHNFKEKALTMPRTGAASALLPDRRL